MFCTHIEQSFLSWTSKLHINRIIALMLEKNGKPFKKRISQIYFLSWAIRALHPQLLSANLSIMNWYFYFLKMLVLINLESLNVSWPSRLVGLRIRMYLVSLKPWKPFAGWNASPAGHPLRTNTTSLLAAVLWGVRPTTFLPPLLLTAYTALIITSIRFIAERRRI